MSQEERRNPSIKPAPDGPYLLKGLETLTNRKGAIATSPSMARCRCGESANKPFCDGTHSRIGFSSARLKEVEDKRDDYTGDGITIHDNRGICAHAGRCTDGIAAVFRLKQEPWIDPNGASREEIIAAVRTCPSGALSYSVDGVEHREREGAPAIFVAPNGPYVVTGGPELTDTPWGEGAARGHFTLCRCGGSKNKPFCDGSHWSRKFTDEKNL